MPMVEAVGRYDFETLVRVLALGLGRTDIDQVRDEAWRTGMEALVGPVTRFLVIVASGGTPPTGKGAEDDAGVPTESITLAELCDEMAGIAMGWLGWSPETALGADMNAIRVAYDGRIDMLKACFGGGDDKPASTAPQVQSRPLTPALFDALFGARA